VLIYTFSVATGYGQPSFIPFDDLLKPQGPNIHAQQVPQELKNRLNIESLCQRISQALDSMSHDREDITNDREVTVLKGLKQDLSLLQNDFDRSDAGGMKISTCF
jgi:hypothetical protein